MLNLKKIIKTIINKIGNTTMGTTATSLTGAIAEHEVDINNIKNNAIKSITRDGTTFTYTRMDNTTGTFTQQDNNTTYSVATTSADGLMSSSDKTKLNAIALKDIMWYNFTYNITNTASGTKSFTYTVANGLSLCSNKAIIGYISGNGTCHATDWSLSLSGTTATISFYFFNPNNFTGSLAFGGVFLLQKR